MYRPEHCNSAALRTNGKGDSAEASFPVGRSVIVASRCASSGT